MPCRNGRRTCRRSRSVSGVSLSSARRRMIPRHARLCAFDLAEPLLEREPFGHLPHDLAGADQVTFEPREPDDLRSEAALAAFLQDPLLAVDLIVPDCDDIRADLFEDVVDVAFMAEDRAVDRLERLDHPEPGGLRHDRLVLELPRGAVARDDDPQLVAELPRLAEKVHMTGMEEIEDPRRHYADHERHARTMSCPSRNTRFLARAYAFASSFETACPSSAIISQIVAVGPRPAMNGRPMRARTSPDRVMQMSPPASLRRVRIEAGDTNSLAIVRSVSASRPSPS